ncbi:MAG TPA: VOC family protein [Candidatus Stackebrandtia excrementipullorum]|nr:VOC family protein [Candidatus Stackebrandtia excrementipullorum]
MTDNKPASGDHTTHGVPHGRTSLTPHIVVSRAGEAVEFYRDVLGARVEDITRMGDLIAHAELDFGSGFLTVSDPLPGYGLAATDTTDDATYSLAVYVDDVDTVMALAEKAGATIREPATTFVSGDRFGSFIDPFGVRWSPMTRVEDLSPEESRRRVTEWAATQQT